MDKWKTSWYPDDKKLGFFGQIFKRLCHTVIKSMSPVAVVLLVTSHVVLGTFPFEPWFPQLEPSNQLTELPR